MRIVVVGASVAGVSAAEALRARGFEGEVIVLGAESGPPYDRPPLSKQYLLGEMSRAEVDLRPQGALGSIGVRLLDGRAAEALDLERRTIAIAGGEQLEFDGLIIATGSSPRHLPALAEIDGVHLLRTADQATAIRAELDSARQVAVIGAGFIGLEAASVAAARGKAATVVDVAPEPMGRLLSPVVGRLFADLHRGHGVSIRCGVEVEGVSGEDRVRGVRLGSGETIEADLVVVGVGAAPNTDWLEGSGLKLADGVVCDEILRAAPRVFAAGDVARWRHPAFGTIRVEHWTTAVDHARSAAANLLAELSDEAEFVAADDVPYFWSDQHGVKIQMAGWSPEAEEVTATVEPGRMLLLFGRQRKLVAAMAWNWPRELALHRRMIAAERDFAETVAAAPGEPADVTSALARFDPTLAPAAHEDDFSGLLI